MLLLCVGPKPVPVIVMVEPTGPTFGEMPVTESGPSTVKDTPALVIPFWVTVTGPLVAPVGTKTVMLVSVQEVILAERLLNCTVHWLVPNPVPLSVTVLLI